MKILALLLSFVIVGNAHAERPNIVLFIADDLSWHDVGPYGASDARTPNLNKLASESMRFACAFAASPTCTPSRSAIYTGMYPFRNGAHANHSIIRDGVRTLPHYMKELGYRVVLAGKTHIGAREAFPFEYLKGSNIMPPGKNHVLWTDLSTAAVDEMLASHDRNQPLCLIVASHSPHVYWMDNDGYDPAAIKLPPYLIDTPQTRAARCKYLSDVSWMDKQLGELLASLAKLGYAQNTMLIFTADQGGQWPLAKWNLYDAGIRAPLLVRWPGRVTGGSSSGAIVSLIDLLPTFIEAAGGTPPADIDAKSFLRVLLGKSDRHHDAVFAAHTGDGQMNRSPMRCVRTACYKYIANLKPDEVYKTHIDSSPGPDGRDYWVSWIEKADSDAPAAKLIDRYKHRPAEEFYDVEADPYELTNLAADPAHADAIKELRERLKQWRLQQGETLDKVPMPEDAARGDIRYAD